RHSVMVRVMYSTGVPPALRTTRTALGMCVPLLQAFSRAALEASTYLVTLTSWTLALPAPAPPPMWAVPLLLMPQLHARMSISAACDLSRASPLKISLSNFRNISTAMCYSSNSKQGWEPPSSGCVRGAWAGDGTGPALLEHGDACPRPRVGCFRCWQ